MAMAMATIFNFLKAIPLLFFLSDLSMNVVGIGVGINYGQLGNDLPSPSHVLSMLQSNDISRVKLYDTNPEILKAFANSNIELIIGLGNEYLQRMTDPSQAQTWIQENVQPYLSQTTITCITVGNEVLTGTDLQMNSNLLPTMKNLYNALSNLGLSKQVFVTTAHSYGVLGSSFPPSSGAFKQDLLEQYILPILNFHSQTGSPFLINSYPFFAYKDNPGQVSLDYVLFQPNSGQQDPVTNLKYDNMFYAQIDAVYSAIKATGHTNIQVKISETGWPSKGDSNEAGATPQNAALYNGNLLRRIQQNQGTPAQPSIPVDVYLFALFNENMKTGPTSERNYGLYYPNGSVVYDIGLQGSVQPGQGYVQPGQGYVQPGPGSVQQGFTPMDFSSSGKTKTGLSVLDLLLQQLLVSLVFLVMVKAEIII